jgi:hypothetical protein
MLVFLIRNLLMRPSAVTWQCVLGPEQHIDVAFPPRSAISFMQARNG